MARVENKGFKEVPRIVNSSCFGCQFRTTRVSSLCPNFNRCIKHNCILVKENTIRKDAWDTISDYFEEWSNSNDRNGGDMVAVAQDAIVADDLYLAFKIDDLRNLEAKEFKTEVIKLLKDFE